LRQSRTDEIQIELDSRAQHDRVTDAVECCSWLEHQFSSGIRTGVAVGRRHRQRAAENVNATDNCLCVWRSRERPWIELNVQLAVRAGNRRCVNGNVIADAIRGFCAARRRTLGRHHVAEGIMQRHEDIVHAVVSVEMTTKYLKALTEVAGHRAATGHTISPIHDGRELIGRFGAVGGEERN